MNYRSNFLRIILVASLPISSLSFGMQAGQQPHAQQNQTPDILGTIRTVVDWIKNNPIPSTAIGGAAAFALLKLMGGKTEEQKAAKSTPSAQNQNQGARRANPAARLALEELAQHAARVGELFQAKQLPPAYLYKKYCAIAKRSGFASLPLALRKELANACLAFDLAFTGYDLETKRKVGLQAALQKAAQRLNLAFQQAFARAGGVEPQAQSTASSQAAKPQEGQPLNFGFGSMFQVFMNQFKANPLGTIGAILSTGYNLLAQINGWWPHNDPKKNQNAGARPNPQPDPAPRPQPAPEQAQQPAQQDAAQSANNNDHQAQRAEDLQQNPNGRPGLDTVD